MWGDFKNFAIKGNVLDMAVGVIIGGAFGKIVTSLVNDLLMPLFGVLLGGIDFSDLQYPIRDSNIMYGMFLQSIVDFLIISFSIFLFIRSLSRLKGHHKEEEPEEPEEPTPTNEEILLTEIRDLLKEDRTK
ncbi:MAG: large conductance mechanosensitive channel protein MscL [Clostridiales bacterium]|nr:large conductance mechanosensitive channel protein MscL [Clostridiales bacterium]